MTTDITPKPEKGLESPKFSEKPNPAPKGKCCKTGCPDCPWGYTQSGIDPEYPAELQQVNDDEEWD